MSKHLASAFLLMGIVLFGAEVTGASEISPATAGLLRAQQALGLEKGDQRMLAVTNAGYGTFKGGSSEVFLDAISEITGCTMGKGNLLMVHTPFTEPLWFALFRKDSGKLIFNRWQKSAFQQMEINASPKHIMNPEAWTKAAKKPMGRKTLFSVVSIASSWSMGAPWPLLKSAEFHNHVCPGLHAGCILAKHLESALPLKKGEKYQFITSPPYCPADALQVLKDATVGKKSLFSKGLNKKMMKQYAGTLWHEEAPLPPLLAIVIKVNQKADVCEGAIIAMDWKGLYSDLGMDPKTLSPKGGKKNPLFHIVRTDLSLKMLEMPMADRLKYIKEIKRFTGKASLAKKLAQAGTNPYAVIWDL